MADAPIPQTETSSALAATTAPAPEPVVTAPIAETPAAPIATPAPDASREAEPVKTEAAPASALLSAEPTSEPAKTETPDAPKVEEVKTEVKPEGDKPTAEQPVLPTYEPFKVAEGSKIDEKVLGEFTGFLGKLELAKGDHKATQEIGQSLVEFYQTNVANVLKAQNDYFVSLHEQQKSKDIEALRNDPVISGKGDDKVLTKNMQDIVNSLNRHGGSKEEMTQFRQTLQERGVEGSLPIARVLKNLTDKINRYENESSKMLPGAKPAMNKPPVGKGILNSLYSGQKSA